MTENTDSEFLTVAETARILRVTERCLRGWIADGTVPAYRIGDKAIRIKRADLDALLKPVATTEATR